MQLRHPVRFVTAASLFDGHDAAIHIMRRILQSEGAEVIHLGHDRSAYSVVKAAIEEDAQGIAVSSYQGGHIEYFSYMLELLKNASASHIQIFGGGGGVIVPEEIAHLEKIGIKKIFSPDDGHKMGLVGMIQFMLSSCDYLFAPVEKLPEPNATRMMMSRTLSTLELGFDDERYPEFVHAKNNLLPQIYHLDTIKKRAPIVGITGTGGAGKSSLIDEMLLRFLMMFPTKKIAVLSIDPTRSKTKGALLGDRIRMNAADNDRIFVRSMATRNINASVSQATEAAVSYLSRCDFDLVILETAGIGQSDLAVKDLVDFSVYVMTPEYGAPSQLEKIGMLDYADLIAINKFDKPGSFDALRDVKKTYARNHQAFNQSVDTMPVFGTCAHIFGDLGTNRFFNRLVEKLSWPYASPLPEGEPANNPLIPRQKSRYLSLVADTVREHHLHIDEQAQLLEKIDALQLAQTEIKAHGSDATAQKILNDTQEQLSKQLDTNLAADIDHYLARAQSYDSDNATYEVRGKQIHVNNIYESMSHLAIPKVKTITSKRRADIAKFIGKENLPGYFPFTAGVFPFKRLEEDPTRMFAGEGGPERTNKRFHFLSQGIPASRLSTAFDSVTLYGENPDVRPDIYGKIGNAGVSVCSLDDAKRLYSGFDLCSPTTSVSMTINGPAPTMLAYYFNAAIDMAVEHELKSTGQWQATQEKISTIFRNENIAAPKYRAASLPDGHNGIGLGFLGLPSSMVVDENLYTSIKARVLKQIRGTIQADILKEDQAQNTCIFSTDFSMRCMGDCQEYFIKNDISNFYSVSISGYHIAEAGANPISQLAFTLANGFTLLEYYRSRGMDVNEFARNFSFFFSNGIDPEYAVIGRVARRIWAIALKTIYGANERSQKLKYHIQTSGRSLHAQEMAFNDIRTTLQALYAIADNCNSLHTNAFDEAITTPTEHSVRRAVAIQMIINKELGLTKNENPWQGSYFLEYLTDEVERAVLKVFDNLDARGGVLGAMETMYQRSTIQEESLYYEQKKHTGELPIIGVNTFLDPHPQEIDKHIELMRSSTEEKNQQVEQVAFLKKRFIKERAASLDRLKKAVLRRENTFIELMEATKYATIGEITHSFFEVGGAYRRAM